jgi:preprotein translocase subunit SecA
MFNSDRVAAIMDRLSIPADVPVENKVVSRAIRSAQTQVEQQNFEIRKDVLKYDDVLNRQRKVIYGERRRVLEGADLHEQIRSMIDEVVASYVAGATTDGYPEEWDLEKLWRAFKQLYPITLRIDEVIEEAGGDKANITADLITEMVTEDAHAAYDRREQELTPDLMREIERRVVLSVLDRKWREHLYEMDYLREGIGLRAMAQRDPLVEYQREGFDMFNSMMDGIKEESVGNLFNLQFEVQENPIVEEASGAAPGAATAAPAVAAVQPAAPAPVPPPAAFGAPAGQAVAERGGPGAGAQGGGRHAGRPAAQQSGPGQSGPGQNGPGQNGPGERGSGQGGSGPGGGRQAGGGARQGRGRHAAGDGRGHATAAGRGQAATQSGGGAHAAAAGGAAPPGAASQGPGPQGPVPAGFEPRRPRQLQYSAPSEGGGVEHRGDSTANPYANVGRNDLCPCGSGRKFKRCHGDPRNA